MALFWPVAKDSPSMDLLITLSPPSNPTPKLSSSIEGKDDWHARGLRSRKIRLTYMKDSSLLSLRGRKARAPLFVTPPLIFRPIGRSVRRGRTLVGLTKDWWDNRHRSNRHAAGRLLVYEPSSGPALRVTCACGAIEQVWVATLAWDSAGPWRPELYHPDFVICIRAHRKVISRNAYPYLKHAG